MIKIILIIISVFIITPIMFGFFVMVLDLWQMMFDYIMRWLR